MFKRKRFIMPILVFIFLVFVTACGNESSSNKGSNEEVDKTEFTLTYSDNEAPGSMRTKFIEEVWISEIEKQTNNQVKVNPTYGGALLTGSEALEGIGDGIADMGVVFPGHTTEKLYAYQIFKLFYEAPTEWENINEVYEKAFEQLPLLDEQLETHNQKRLLTTSGLPMVFGANYEMKSLNDLKGKDWRAASRWHLKTLEELGANPVSVPWSDVYTSLATGVIDGVYTNFDSYHAEKMYENSESVLVAAQFWTGTPFIHTINLDTWNSLPEDIQEGITKATEIAQEKFGETYADALETAVEEERSAGYDIEITEQKDVQPFIDEELLGNMRDTWVNETEANHGMEDAETYIKTMQEILEEGMQKEE